MCFCSLSCFFFFHLLFYLCYPISTCAFFLAFSLSIYNLFNQKFAQVNLMWFFIYPDFRYTSIHNTSIIITIIIIIINLQTHHTSRCRTLSINPFSCICILLHYTILLNQYYSLSLNSLSFLSIYLSICPF